MTLSPAEVTGLLEAHGLAPRKSLGQNFVADANTVRRIAHLAGVGPGDRVLEIGPGLGSLTLALAETGARVVAIEADPGLAGVLVGVLADRGLDARAVPPSSLAAGAGGPDVEVVTADALALPLADLLAPPAGWVAVANLPYNVAAPLVLELLEDVPVVSRLLVMVQREVGERLVAPPGTRTYGIPSVVVAYHATGRIAGAVPASVFVPRPRVDSVLVELVRRPTPATDADHDQLFTLVRTAFGQRRKMLRRSLVDLVDSEDFAAAGVQPTARPEQLDIVTWGRLAAAVAAGAGVRGGTDDG
jgi:16S rRNA (adenine1518-N6/adenine1519-N6)-dimethyltransferase